MSKLCFDFLGSSLYATTSPFAAELPAIAKPEPVLDQYLKERATSWFRAFKARHS